MAISNSDLRTWSENDLRQVTTLFCEMLSVRRDYLMDFVYGIVKSYWNTAKNGKKGPCLMNSSFLLYNLSVSMENFPLG